MFLLFGRVMLALADAILPPVNDDCLPGNERGIIACQKQDGPGYVFRFLHPLNGLLFPGGAFLLVRLRRSCQSIRLSNRTTTTTKQMRVSRSQTINIPITMCKLASY